MNKVSVILIILVVLGGAFYLYLRIFSANPPAPIPVVPCENATGTEPGTPVITSISPTSGSVGVKIDIKGCNFSGFEGDRNAWIENAWGVKGILYGEPASTNNLIRAALRSPLCQKGTSYSGMPCGAWLTLAPGVYIIYVTPWGTKSNEVVFTIK